MHIRLTIPGAAPSMFALCLALSLPSCSDSSPRGAGSDTTGEPSGASDGTASNKPKGADAGTKKPSSSSSGKTPASGTPANDDPTSQDPATDHSSTSSDPLAIDDCGDDNEAGVSSADAAKLKAGVGKSSGLKWLYPYEGTVFPRGMLAPDLMWDGPAADALYVHIKSQVFEYWGCLKPTEPGRLAMDQEVWDQAGEHSQGKKDIYTVELSALSGGQVSGSSTSHFQIAQAAIKGSIFYNTYSSKLVGAGGAAPPAGADPTGGLGGIGGFPGAGGGFGASGGVVLRIPPGGRAEVFGQTDCNGCHSVSADGSRLLAQSVANGAYSYSLMANGPAPTPKMAGGSASWAALYPDGSAFLAMSTVIDVARAAIFGGLIGGGGGNGDATLYDANTGAKLTSTGIPAGVLMPDFSPDGTQLVFNDYALGQGAGLALMQYDTSTHTASDYQMLFMDSGSTRPGWPFILPDNNGVIFIRTADGDFTGGGVGISGGLAAGGGAGAPFSELSVVDIASRKTTLLAKAMGYNTAEDAAKNSTYLPFGDDDLHHTYYPTVSPVASGGYFWIFFDSIRHYGGLGLQRQLWGAALDISPDGSYTTDPSHPPFYLSGQEAGAGNHRAFAALDPCHQDGDKCTTGIDCCGGFCFNESPAGEGYDPVGTCSPMKTLCSKRDERCSVDADCCAPKGNDSPNNCIAGFCAFVPVI